MVLTLLGFGATVATLVHLARRPQAISRVTARLRRSSVGAGHRLLGRRVRLSSDQGQATAEYALVMLGAAAIAVLLIAWATQGGGAGRIGQLLDRVMDAITSRVS
jgi:Flp pilus assembly pilin Flp